MTLDVTYLYKIIFFFCPFSSCKNEKKLSLDLKKLNFTVKINIRLLLVHR